MALKPYNYDNLAAYYDVLETDGTDSERMNDFLTKVFREEGVKTIFDMTCGTGVQAIGLKKRSFKVTASDISKGMLAIAKKKSKGLNVPFFRGDVRTLRKGTFDAVITIFNAIGHLTPVGFEQAIRNISANLKDDGLYVFDIFNLDFMKRGFKHYRFIDTAGERDRLKFVRFNKNTFDRRKGIMHISQEIHIQHSGKPITYFREGWDMQIYSVDQIRKLLSRNGFSLVGLYGGPGKKFNKKKSAFILAVARKNAKKKK